jgi:hypothetical protein
MNVACSNNPPQVQALNPSVQWLRFPGFQCSTIKMFLEHWRWRYGKCWCETYSPKVAYDFLLARRVSPLPRI